jgi:nucleoside diphosphate kinase
MTGEQLAYVLINPYTIYKSRTGGVISRLFTRTALELVCARMFAPSPELVREFADTIPDPTVKDKRQRQMRELIRDYVLTNYAPDPKTERRRRVLALVFRGENAVEKIRLAAGPITHQARTGETIRDTYGDYIVGENGEVKYFEPAILVAQTPEDAERTLKLWAKYSETDGGLMEKIIPHDPHASVEQTLVLLKPDNFRFPSGRPGNILDMFSRAGLFIIGFKVHRMSVAEAEEFYAPVREVLREKLAGPAGQRAALALEKEFGFKIPSELQTQIGKSLGPITADNQFNQIVRFMTGRNPAECSPAEKRQPGTEKIVAVVYEGPDAVKKIRNVLGPTDPRQAPPGTIRRELGQDIMVNAAHASDSPENAKREMNIIKISENNLKPLVEEFYRCKL